MIIRSCALALSSALLFNALGTDALSSRDIPSDTPIGSLVSSAKANLAQGNSNDALIYFDAAVSRDPNNYLTIFQRGATHLSLGKATQAEDDFNRVLTIKPDFEGALLQRAKIKSRRADWKSAREDYQVAGLTTTEDYGLLEEAEKAAVLAATAEEAGDYEACATHAGTAILVASTAMSLRQLRARCRFERTEIIEGISDLQHVLQLAPGSTEPHLQISAMQFYALDEQEKGLGQVRKCLHSDPDSKACKLLHKREKKINKVLKEIDQLKQQRRFSNAIKLLVGSEQEEGLLFMVKEDVSSAKESKMITPKAPNQFYGRLVEMTCEFYGEMDNKNKALPYCNEALELDSHSLPGLLSKAQRQLDVDDFEPAVHTLNTAKEHHAGEARIDSLLQNAHTLLRRSKTKDYYKELELPRDADSRQIKSKYRKLVKRHHPDKAAAQGHDRVTAEKKMAQINEAYEVLSNPELKERFDRGDDPNSQEQQQQHPFHGSPFSQGAGGQQFFFKQGGGGPSFQFQGGFPFG